MAVPKVTCGPDIVLSFSGSAQLVSLAAAATGSPTSWRWDMLSVPPGSTANVGINGDFVDGVSTIQNPTAYVDAGVFGGYCFQCKAYNGEGQSDPLIDKAQGQQLVLVSSEDGDIYPPDFGFDWGETYLNPTLRRAIGRLSEAVASVAALRSLTQAVYRDKQVRLVTVKNSFYRFDAASVGVDDGDKILCPNDITPPAPGRWLIIGVTDHEALTGLLGGAPSDHYHLTSSQVGYLPTADEKQALLGTSGAPSVTNKYVTDADGRMGDDRVASGIRTATTVVVMSAATAPSPGQVPTALSSTLADWQDQNDANAIHKNVAGEINALTQKTTPLRTDLFVIEDSADSYNKKKVVLSALGSNTDIAITSHQSTNLVTDIIVGAFSFDPSEWGSLSQYFKATGYVTSSYLTGVVTLYNKTDDSSVVSVNLTGIVQGESISSVLTLPSGKKSYEVRLRVTGGSGLGSSDFVVLEWAGLQLR